MTRLTFALLFALLAGGVTAAATPVARAAGTLCVGSKPGCFATIQAAVDAANDGDTITIAPGTFAGGVAIDVSVDIRGAGAGATTIEGGGPVSRSGRSSRRTEPTISISGVTITGGVNSPFPIMPSRREAVCGSRRAARSRSAPAPRSRSATASSPGTPSPRSSSSLPGFCGPFDCSFASGGGIFNEGTLTLSTRGHRQPGRRPASVTVVASAGGILNSRRGTLTLRHSVVTGNRASAPRPGATPPTGAGSSRRGPVRSRTAS